MKNTRSKLFTGLCTVAMLCVGSVASAQSHDKRCSLKPYFDAKVDSCTVNFTDQSTAGSKTTITSWSWDFGDGSTDGVQNPSHAYPTGGTYKVTLTITGMDADSNVCDRSYDRYITLKGCGNDCHVKAGFYERDSCLTAKFHDVSDAGWGSTITAWSWDFGDGTTSSDQNPEHLYGAGGTYTVCLTVTGLNKDSSECTRLYCRQVTVEDCSNAPCHIKPYFKSFNDTTCLTVNFFGSANAAPGTTITGWLWDFGDGTTSTSQNPVHVFANPGVYNNVCLTVTAVGGNGSQCDQTYCGRVEVRDCGTNMCYIRPGFGERDSCLTVRFRDYSSTAKGTVITDWSWDFGDGTTSADQNPEHVYATEGTYDVCLTLTAMDRDSAQCTRTYCKQVKVRDCSNAPCHVKPHFKYEKDTTCLTVNFMGDAEVVPGTTITGWSWDFGDGSTSNSQNPSHTYANAGVYNSVCLTVTAIGGDSSVCEQTYCRRVEVRDNCSNDDCYIRPSFCMRDSCMTVSFHDNSGTRNGTTITGWSWDFGDGSTSTDQHPDYTYATEGTYNVCLTVTAMDHDSVACTRTYCRHVTVNDCSDAPCYIRPGFRTRDSCMTVKFMNFTFVMPGTTINSWTWDFGDSTTSNVKSPTHTYAAVGDYTVTLTVSGTGGDSTTCDRSYTRKIKVDQQCAPRAEGMAAGNSNLSGLTIMPNPANSQASIRFEMSESGQASVKVYDLQGKVLSVIQDGYLQAGQHQMQWNIDVPPGVYMMVVNTGADIRHQQVIVK
ncbi:MAG: PKD domain-containing protein [Flavobacteriales bacterium]|nr:PKD domain-containing protein [Flavobacteriales bacterium]